MKIAGILNVTEDSFSDGGKYLEVVDYLKQIDYLIQSGADVIDIGAQSSNIHAKIISDEEEWNRLRPICKTLKFKNIQSFPVQIIFIPINHFRNLPCADHSGTIATG
ncbi:MAG: hypothetical protein EBS19_13565 [Spirochaetia bacterium]|nr:hypothetical protein [Spirochaetia bacterium]